VNDVESPPQAEATVTLKERRRKPFVKFFIGRSFSRVPSSSHRGLRDPSVHRAFEWGGGRCERWFSAA
jgi:hypothetical protein